MQWTLVWGIFRKSKPMHFHMHCLVWNGVHDIIQYQAGPIKEESVNFDLFNSPLNY